MKTVRVALRIVDPDGRPRPAVELTQNLVTVGRPVPDSRPDVAIEPDPEKWVSRVHCLVERGGGGWWLVDNDPPNGTFVRRGASFDRVSGRRRLADGDIICIPAGLGSEGPRWWQLAFADPFATRRTDNDFAHVAPCAHYDWVQARLFRCEGGSPLEINGLTAHAHMLIRFMVHRSEQNSGSAVACTHEELIGAVWGEPSEWPKYRTYTVTNLRDLVYGLREKLELDAANPVVLETVPGVGYRLITCTPARPTD